MKLRLIREWEQPQPQPGQPTQEDLESMGLISAAGLIDSGFAAWHKPFIYCPESHLKLYMGPSNGYHSELLHQLERSQPEEHRKYESTYYGHVDGSVGRIGRGIIRLEDSTTWKYKKVDYPTLELVAFYDRTSGGNIGWDAAAVKALIQGKYIKPDAIVCYEGGTFPAATFAAKANPEPDLEPEEEKSTPGMQAAMRKAGLLGPGQKWWAPHSEGKKR